MLKEINSYRNVIDYMYLLRILKLSKSGLIKLFQNQTMNISQLKTSKRDDLIKLLLNKKKVILEDYAKISELYDFDPTHEEKYIELEKMVKYCLQKNIKIITPLEKDIPKLFQILEPIRCDLIFIKGEIIDNDLRSYSICGSRTPTKEAISKARQIARLFAKHKFTLINGFAKGIDIEAFIGAKELNGRYIGVLASGVENVYPNENKQYIQAVIKNGALISQNFIWNRVNRTALQLRNRFSAQLSLGSIFIEGNYRSGTIWQYKFAKEARRPVFYLEPKNWEHENAHILKIVRDGGGIEIKNDLSNIDKIIDILEEEYLSRLEFFNDKAH